MALPPVKPRAWLFDVFGDYVEPRHGELWTGSIISLASQFDLTERAIRSALLRLQRDGWLAVRRSGARSFYGLTAAGRDLIERGRERIMRGPEREWDGRWAVLTYTVPEAQRELRDRLRKELGWLGFGGLGSGLFLSPHDRQAELEELVRRYGLDSNIVLFRAEHAWPGDNRVLAARCWDLADLNARYAEFVETFSGYCEAQGLGDRECFVVRCRLIGGYRRFPFLDPGLPRDLLPGDWLGFRAWALFRDLHDRLAPGAERYFDEVTAASAA
jgi:phenylacetic acid degradation operon negative regulatory protein